MYTLRILIRPPSQLSFGGCTFMHDIMVYLTLSHTHTWHELALSAGYDYLMAQ
jgi:hypothetical protein